MASIVVVGSYNRDVSLFVTRLPAPGETRLSLGRLESPGGKHLVSVSCEGAWVLLKLAPGTYTISAHLQGGMGHAATTTIRAPAHGQGRFVVVFPDA